MMKKKRILALIGMFSSLCLGNLAFSESVDPAKRPLGCKDIGYRFEFKILRLLPLETSDQQSLYFIYNAESKNINLYQMRGEESTRSIYMNHVIRPHEWAVLSTSEPEVKYICTINDGVSNYGRVVDCSERLKVCEYTRVKYGMNNRGNFWLADSPSSTAAVFEVLHYGIIPR